MIFVRLKGGLGNQMFQYAAGRRLAECNRDEVVLDLTLLLDHSPSLGMVPRNYDLHVFDALRADLTLLSRTAQSLPLAAGLCRRGSLYATRVKAMIGAQTLTTESGLRFDPRILRLKGNVYLDGYWQSAKYFSDIDTAIRNEFSFGPVLDCDVAELAKSIEESNAVCLHVRRGDFVHRPVTARTHGFVGKQYYDAGVAFITERAEEPHFFIFSDDMDWCRANLAIDAPHTFVGHQFKGTKFREDLRLMSLCKHFLIPNSTFAWWAAWLSRNPDKLVVAPKRWFADAAVDPSDIYLPSWFQL